MLLPPPCSAPGRVELMKRRTNELYFCLRPQR
jgi:hypothetical protein